MVSGAAISGNRESGGSASAPTAPETKAMARLFEPQDRMIPSTSAAAALDRGRIMESATLKGSPLVARRIAIRRP